MGFRNWRQRCSGLDHEVVYEDKDYRIHLYYLRYPVKLAKLVDILLLAIPVLMISSLWFLDQGILQSSFLSANEIFIVVIFGGIIFLFVVFAVFIDVISAQLGFRHQMRSCMVTCLSATKIADPQAMLVTINDQTPHQLGSRQVSSNDGYYSFHLGSVRLAKTTDFHTLSLPKKSISISNDIVYHNNCYYRVPVQLGIELLTTNHPTVADLPIQDPFQSRRRSIAKTTVFLTIFWTGLGLIVHFFS